MSSQLDAKPPKPIIYAVWIRGIGWLNPGDSMAPERLTPRHHLETTFTTTQREVADAAARMWGKAATVIPWDESMYYLEKVFLEREKVNRRWHVLG